MLKPSPQFPRLFFLLSLVLLFSCQDQKPPQIKSEKPELNTNQSHSPYTEFDWPQAIHYFEQSYSALEKAQNLSSKVNQLVQLLREFAVAWPMLTPFLRLKEAELYLSVGQWEKGNEIAQSLWGQGKLIETSARYFIAQHTYQCRSLSDSLTSPLFDQKSEIYLLTKLRLATHCGQKRQQTLAEKNLVSAFPKYFQSHHVKTLFKSMSLSSILKLASSWEKKQAPEQAQKLLKGYRKMFALGEKDEWTLKYEYERIQVERIREDYLKSIKKIRPLTQSKSQGGRQASLLLAKAWSKAKRPRQAIKVYKELIREWRHSKEANQARFNLAFLHYEQQKYSLALKGFAELTRHKGELKALKNYKGRVKKAGLRQSAEWYYAWCLYLRSPKKAAPFLEALIGEGLPLSSQGRRAAYWAAKAYSESQPERAAQLRKSLLTSSWGDWYSLLLRAQDPSLANDDAAWPLMPPQSKALFTTQASSVDKQQLSLEPKTFNLNSSETLIIEHLVMQRQLAIILKQPFLVKSLDQKLHQLLQAQLNESQQYSPWPVEAEQYKLLHRFMVNQNVSRLRTLPQVENHQWWRSVYPLAYEALVHQASKSHKISPELILSFIYKESAFAPRAISHAYAMGLMQLLEKTAQALHPEKAMPNLLNPEENINLGTEYLAALANRYHDQIPLVAAAYNAGPQNLNSWLKKSQRKLDLFVEMIPFKEARGYVKKLSAIYCVYLFLYGQTSINQCASQLPLILNTEVEPGVNF